MQLVLYTSNVSYLRAFICQTKAGLLIKVKTPNCQLLSSTRENNQGDLNIATKNCSSTQDIKGLEHSKLVRKPLFLSKVGREVKSVEKKKKIAKITPTTKKKKKKECQKARR